MIKNKVQLITYPDSLGGNIKELHNVINTHFKNCFEGGIHILPPYPSSGDRGFAPISYFEIEKTFGTWEDINSFGQEYDLMVDLMVNHISQQSEYFKDYLKYGSNSKYANFFINLDKYWENGIPKKEDLEKIFLRRDKPYSTFNVAGVQKNIWTTFGKTDPSEQIDLDIEQEDVKNYFCEIFKKFSEENIKFVRLDAIGYVNKKIGTSCFFVEPEIYNFTDWLMEKADEYGIGLLPEVHSHYSYQYKLSKKGYWIYDFILPYTVLSTIVNKNASNLLKYLADRPKKQFTMLDCHDGIPIVPDLNDFFDIEEAKNVVSICEKNGANFSRIYNDDHKIEGFDVHQINSTYYDALGKNDDAYIFARCIQFFVPGVPQVYYVGLLAGENYYEGIDISGDGRDNNRYNYSLGEIEKECNKDVVKRLIRLIEFRNTNIEFDGIFTFRKIEDNQFEFKWENGPSVLEINFDLANTKVEVRKIFQNECIDKFIP